MHQICSKFAWEQKFDKTLSEINLYFMFLLSEIYYPFLISTLPEIEFCNIILQNRWCCCPRVFQCVKSYKVYIFSPESHSTIHENFKTVKNLKIKAYFELPHPFRSFIQQRMQQRFLSKTFLLKNQTSQHSNGLNCQYISSVGSKF